MDPETGIILNDEMDDFATPDIPDAFGLRREFPHYIALNSLAHCFLSLQHHLSTSQKQENVPSPLACH